MTWRRKPPTLVELWNGVRTVLGVRPDRRHVRSLLRELGMESCRSISTPLCATVEKEGNPSDRPEVSAELATKHRAAVARVVYLAQDRLAKSMAIPREGHAMVPSSGRNRHSCFNHGG